MEHTILIRLIEITLYSAAVFCAVLLFRRVLSGRLSPRLRYALWFVLLLRLVVPVTFESGFHPITLPAEQAAAMISPVASARQTPAAGAAQTEPLSAEAAVRAAPAAPTLPPKRVAALNWRQWLLMAWAAGAVAVAAAYAALAVRLNRRVRANGSAPDAETGRLYRQALTRAGVRRNIPLLLLGEIESPALTAQLCPKLLLPSRISSTVSAEDLLFSLTHELTHYRRGDHLVCMLLMLLRAVWWFNPVVWIMPRFLRADMESACDARVVRGMDRQQRLRYANLLLELGEGERST